MGKRLEQTLHERGYMDDRQTHEKMLMSLAIREVQIKITMRCYCIPIRLTKIKNTENIKSWQAG